MAEQFFENLVALGIPGDVNVNSWILDKFQATSQCSLDEFCSFFLNLVKSQTDEFVKNSTSTCNTPRKPKLSISVDTPETQVISSVKEGPVKGDLRKDLFGNKSVDKNNDSFVSLNNSTTFNESTPVHHQKRRNFNLSDASTSTPKTTPFRNSLSFDKSSTFKNSKNSLDFSSSRNNSINKRNSSSPMCISLGDFMNTSSTSTSTHSQMDRSFKKKNEQNPSFSKDDFPSLGKEDNVKKEKPKRRVVPLTISKKCTNDVQQFTSSSFFNENNLLNVTPSDEVDFMKNRRMLCEERVDVSKDFHAENQPEKNLHTILKESLPNMNSPVKSQTTVVQTIEFDDTKVERKELIYIISQIYSFILDMNLVPNVLAEFAYLFNLLNTDFDPFETMQNGCSSSMTILETARFVLKNFHNCIYFVMNVLKLQKSSLALLDAMTIRVILDNERFQTISSDLTEFFKSQLQQKSQLIADKAVNSSFSNNIVFYQQETDNLDNFPSTKEFQAFRKQRDMFYEVLRTWEVRHLDPTWDFRKGLEFKIKSLITLLDHPINMAHLARLFTAQIVVSCNFDDPTNELQAVLPNVDMQKLSKLRQRLITPGAFSNEYLFPGTQAFFRDFILCCDHYRVFMEQLKISMISELIQINDSSIETFCILPRSNDRKEMDPNGDYVVQAETMITMRILAKFIGFIVSRPYAYEGYRNTTVDQKQFKMRNSVGFLQSILVCIYFNF